MRVGVRLADGGRAVRGVLTHQDGLGTISLKVRFTLKWTSIERVDFTQPVQNGSKRI